MGGGRASASVRPDESTALPPLPSYDLPLWNEHSKDKLQGVLTHKGSLAKHVKHQEKAFGPFLPCVKDQIAAFQAESEKGMESFARIGRCLVTGEIGVADAYYCAECVALGRNRDGCPKVINLSQSRKDLFYERKKYGFKRR